MAGRSARSRRASQDSGILLNMRTPERQRRSLSQGDDTPRPTGVLQGAGSAATSAGSSSLNTGQSVQMHVGDASIAASLLHVGADPPGHTPNKRLGFLGEKLLSSSVSATSTLRGTPTSQLLPRSHSRAESANLLTLREGAASPAPSMATISASPLAKGHTSPSKVSTLSSCGQRAILERWSMMNMEAAKEMEMRPRSDCDGYRSEGNRYHGRGSHPVADPFIYTSLRVMSIKSLTLHTNSSSRARCTVWGHSPIYPSSILRYLQPRV